VKLTPERLAGFCAALSSSGANVRVACAAVSITADTAYKWRGLYPAFARAWDEAKELGLNLLESECTRRAYEGTLVPVVHNGVVLGWTVEYSDRLARFLLTANRPEKYRRVVHIDEVRAVRAARDARVAASAAAAATNQVERATRTADLLRRAAE